MPGVPNVVYVLSMEEIELGWSSRFDGYVYCLTGEAVRHFVASIEKARKGYPPEFNRVIKTQFIQLTPTGMEQVIAACSNTEHPWLWTNSELFDPESLSMLS